MASAASALKKALKPGDYVNARAASVFSNKKENEGIHGKLAYSIRLTGRVVKVPTQFASNGARLIYIEADYSFGDGKRSKQRKLNLTQVFLGKASERDV